LEHAICVLQNIIVPKSNYPITTSFKPFSALFICGYLLGMLATV